MRRVLVVEKVDSKGERLAQKLGCPEIACNVPRFEGYVKSLPSVVVESATNPGTILGVFNADKVSKAQLDELADLPEPVKVKSLIEEIDNLKAKLEKLEKK